MADEKNDETAETPEKAPIAEGEGADAAAEATEAHEIPAEASPGAGDAVTPAEPAKSPQERRAARRAAAVAKRGPRRPAPEQREEVRKAKAAQRRRYRARVKEKRAAERADAPAPGTVGPEAAGPAARGRAKTRQGIVVSDKADKTIVVRIDVARRHRRYNKILRSSSTLHVHDERNDANEGDTVRVMESRPMSRTKRWRLVEVVERAR
jgi:small subunit ribosomal protein S17